MAKTQIALTAQQIRKELKETFPLNKFSVRSSSGSIRVEWTDLPSKKAVEAITSKYESVSYDHATGEVLSGGNTYVFTQVNYTPEFKSEVESRMQKSGIVNNYFYYKNFNDTVNQIWEERNTVNVQEVEEVEAVTEQTKTVEVTELQTEVTQSTASADSNTVESTQTQEQIPVQSITINWSESSHIADNTTVSTFAEANSLIRSVANGMKYNNNQGYRKTAFTISWTDGHTHEGRLDIQSNFIDKNNPIGEHVKYFYESLAGLRKPSQWTEEEYKNYLKSIYNIDSEGMEEVKQILAAYLLEDIPTIQDQSNTYDAPETTETASKTQQTETATTITESVSAVTMTINEAMNGIELYFSDKPSEEIRSQLKAHSFRWSNRNKCWYAKQSAKTINFANSLVTDNNNSEATSQPTESTHNVVSYPSIDINDLDKYIVSDELQRALHSASMFQVNYKKECIDTFQFFQNTAISVIESTDSESIQYYIKKYLQSFKKRYYEQYIKSLNHRANNPSWVVTGRGNLNVSRYSKMQDRYANMMRNLVELDKELDNKMEKFKDQIHRHEKENINKEVSFITDIDTIQFKTDKRTVTVAGYTETKRVYIYDQYMITKTWGKFRIFNLNGKEIETNLKTTSTLTDAKQYVMYLLSKNKDQEAVCL